MKKRSIVKSLLGKSRREGLGPNSIEIYGTKAPTGFKASLNAIETGKRDVYRLRASGVAMSINGTVTLSYSAHKLCRLFDISLRTFNYWISKSIIDIPEITVEGKNTHRLWLYHQVQPVFVWYMHLRARGIQNIVPRFHQEELKALARMKRSYLRIWYKRQGIPFIDDYEKYGGKYGVFWKSD